MSSEKASASTGISESSLWWRSVERPIFTPGPISKYWDVAIIGGGFSGLWTAHHLKVNNPELSIAIFEANFVGSGASGRNGGWISALFPVDKEKLRKRDSEGAIDLLFKNLEASVVEIGSFARAANIECGYSKSGTYNVARNLGQLARIKNKIARESIFLDKIEISEKINMSGALGGAFNPNCASVNPYQLLTGLAQDLEAKGVSIYEQARAEVTGRNINVHFQEEEILVNTKYTVRAIEAYHSQTRDQVPIYSLVVATEPIPSELRKLIGISDGETFSEEKHTVTYAQLTEDHRLVVGGRGAPYIFGSKRSDSNESLETVHQKLKAMVIEWFPQLENIKFTHSWGGAVGVTRNWAPYVTWDGSIATMGGYAGDGLGLSYLAANSVADLICRKNSERATLLYVNSPKKRWEPEPLRWIGINAFIAATKAADYEEKLTGRASLIAKALNKLF
jgi:glycine/D-amino acid oxidase-like deaminating enzyme